MPRSSGTVDLKVKLEDRTQRLDRVVFPAEAGNSAREDPTVGCTDRCFGKTLRVENLDEIKQGCPTVQSGFD
jgi:hypothetical protein